MQPPQSLIKKLENYQPGAQVKQLIAEVPTLLLVGISGVGKDTIKQILLTAGKYHHIVSHTTRSPRKNHGIMEQSGVDYHFIDYKTAENMLDNQGYVEAKRYGNNIYGTSVAEFQMAHDEQKIAVTDLEVQGVEEYMQLAPKSVKPVFILPPNFEEWQRRVIERYGNDHEDHAVDIQRRQDTAKQELEHLLKSDYFYCVVNEDLEDTVKIVDSIAKGGALDNKENQRGNEKASEILEALD
jgi:guanylate kinase